MATAAFANPNTVNARSAAIASFERFLKTNCATVAAVDELVANDKTGSVLHQTLDHYGLHLVTSDGSRGKKLARNTVLQYLGQVKNWFVDKHPELSPLLTKRMSDVYSSLETHFKTTTGTTTIRQAPACTKADIAALVDILWRTADSEVDFHDGALVILMWHLLGRSSDMTQLAKQNVVIHPGGSFSIRFGRVKTGVEQGVSLFWSTDFRTCPIHAIALMTAMTEFHPSLSFATSQLGLRMKATPMSTTKFLSLTFSSGTLLNRMPLHPAVHSAAQAANASPKISLQWILDRGGWQLSSLSRGLLYIFNTTTEDRQVGKVLSGWEPDASVWTPRVDECDSVVQAQLRSHLPFVFRSCEFNSEPEFSFQPDVLLQLLMIVVYYYPDVAKANGTGRYRAHMMSVLSNAGYSEFELLAWSLTLRHAQTNATKVTFSVCSEAQMTQSSSSSPEKSVQALLSEQVELIKILIKQNNNLQQRVGSMDQEIAAVKSDAQADTPDINLVRGASAVQHIAIFHEHAHV